MKALELPLHPKLETIFGYLGNAPRVLFYWDSQSDQLMYDDGRESGTANTWAYLIWAGHPSVKANLQNQPQLLLLERQERKLYNLNRTEALEVLASNASVELSVYNQHLEPWKEAQQLLADFVVWLGSQQTHKKAA